MSVHEAAAGKAIAHGMSVETRTYLTIPRVGQFEIGSRCRQRAVAVQEA
jgi:hypothetical protein